MEISDNAFCLDTLFIKYNINYDNGGISRWNIDLFMTKKSFYK